MSDSKLDYIGTSREDVEDQSRVFIENTNNLAVNYTVTAGKNALVIGPLAIADGASITVPDGQRLVVI